MQVLIVIILLPLTIRLYRRERFRSSHWFNLLCVLCMIGLKLWEDLLIRESSWKLTVGVSAELPEGTVFPEAQQAVFPADDHSLHEAVEWRSGLELNRTGPGQRLERRAAERPVDLSVCLLPGRLQFAVLPAHFSFIIKVWLDLQIIVNSSDIGLNSKFEVETSRVQVTNWTCRMSVSIMLLIFLKNFSTLQHWQCHLDISEYFYQNEEFSIYSVILKCTCCFTFTLWNSQSLHAFVLKLQLADFWCTARLWTTGLTGLTGTSSSSSCVQHTSQDLNHKQHSALEMKKTKQKKQPVLLHKADSHECWLVNVSM